MNCIWKPSIIRLNLLVFLLSLAVFPLSANAALLTLTASNGHAPLSGFMEVLKDTSGTLTVQDVTSESFKSRFEALPGDLSAGFVQGGSVWLRFTVQRASDSPQQWALVIAPSVNEILQLFIPSPSGGFETRYGGSLLPFSKQEIPYRLDVFRIALPPMQPTTIYLKIASHRSIMAFPAFWELNALRQAAISESLIHGSYFGIILLTLALIMLCWIFFHESLYVYYFFYVLSFAYIAVDIHGYAHQFIWTGHTEFIPKAIRLFMLLLLAMNAGVLSQMLELRTRLPRFDHWFRTVSFGIAVLGSLLVIAGFHDLIIIPLQISLFVSLCISFIICITLFRQESGARLYLAAFGLLLIMSGKVILNNFDVFRGSLQFSYVFLFSTLTHILVLNFAIINRMARSKHEKQEIEITLALEQQTVEKQSNFLRLISHELRTPLAIIDSTAQILPLLRTDNARFEQKAGAISAAARRMNDLLEKYLTDERISHKGVMANFQATDLQKLVQSVIGRTQAGTEHHQISCIPDQFPKSFLCDPELIDILIGNLLDNAVKYSPDSGAINVKGWKDPKGDVYVEVEDHGVGISSEHASRLFERFYRAGLVQGVSGAGVGLHLAQQIARMHNGEIRFKSNTGRGSIFTVRLPESALTTD